MSFFGSVLNSLEDGKTTISVPKVKPPKPPLAGSVAGQPSTKRKAEDDLRNASSNKTSKISHNKIPSLQLRSSLPPAYKPKIPESQKTIRKDVPQSKPSVPSPNTSKVPLKKGSYAEILARASQQAQSASTVGTIRHKPKEKISAKKEIALQKEMTLKQKKGLAKENSKAINNTSIVKGGSVSTNKTSGDGAASKAVNYQGTSKPKIQQSYKGTMKPQSKVSYTGTTGSIPHTVKKKAYDSEPERSEKKHSLKSRRSGYYSGVASEDEEESDDPYTYNDSDYSDMDAGWDDMEDEDAEAERIAKKEDLAEQARLDELKRIKEERKRKLVAVGNR